MGLLDWFRKKDPKDDFAGRLVRELRRGGEKRPVRYDKERFCVEVGKDHTIYLNNAYDEYCAALPAAQPEIVRRYASMSVDTPVAQTLEEALPHLMPRVRERFYFSSLQLTLQAEGRDFSAFAWKPMTDHFAVELVYDFPDKTMQVVQDQLDKWKTTLDEALRLSHELIRLNTPAPMRAIRPGLYLSEWNDTYAPSRLLLPEYIAQHRVEGEPVAVAANRDLLLLTGSRDSEGLEEMARRVHQAMKQPRFMTGHALVLSEGTWSLFTPESDQLGCTDLLMLRQISMAGFYEDQKAWLDKIHERKGIDLFVGSLTLLQNKETGLIRSYCVWPQGVDTLLPEADDVVFKKADSKGAPDKQSRGIAVSWQAVRNRLGGLMTLEEGYPARYRVKDFPEETILREIGREI